MIVGMSAAKTNGNSEIQATPKGVILTYRGQRQELIIPTGDFSQTDFEDINGIQRITDGGKGRVNGATHSLLKRLIMAGIINVVHSSRGSPDPNIYRRA